MSTRRFWLVGAFMMLSAADCADEKPPAPELKLILRRWSFTKSETGKVGETPIGPDRTEEERVVVKETMDFGPLITFPSGKGPNAEAEVYSNETGSTYWVSAEAPQTQPRPDGSGYQGAYGDAARLSQYQWFRKKDDNATLRLVVSRSFMEAIDGNPGLPSHIECPFRSEGESYASCRRTMWGHAYFYVEAFSYYDQKTILKAGGSAEIFGWRGAFDYDATTDSDSTVPFWDHSRFDFDPDVSDDGGGHATLRLAQPVTIDIPLSQVDKGHDFYIQVSIGTWAHNMRQRESYVSAMLRDPQDMTGLTFDYDGLEVIAPLEVPPPFVPESAPDCPAPDPTAGTVAFEAADFIETELPGVGAPVVVTRSGGSHGEVSVRLTTSDGTAGAGDYDAVDTVVTFADGEEGRRTVRIPILTDGVAEPDKTVNLTLSDPKGCAALGTQSTGVLTIFDDDRPFVGPATYTVGGTVTGLAGTGLVLHEAITGAGTSPTGSTFAFDYHFITGTDYEVRVAQQPQNPFQVCTVTRASGTIADADVTDVAVDCVTVPTNGALDPGFGSGGKVTSGAPATAMALQSDGKIVLVGGKTLARYGTDGMPDTGFGSGGQVTITLLDAAQAVAIQPDGKIVVAGSTRNGSFDDFGVARYLASGMPDTGFGSGGKASVDFAGATDQAWAVLIQTDGSIVLAGHAQTPSPLGPNNDFAVARLTPAGILDGSFGTGGKTTTNIAGRTDLAHAAVLQADDKIVLAGRVADGGGDNPDVGLVRYTSNGIPDESFGSHGIVRRDISGDWDEATDLAVQQPSGKIVVAVSALAGTSFGYEVARFDAGGSLDSSFGTGGVTTTLFSSNNDYVRGLALQPDGKIVLVGGASSLMDPDFGISRYGADGATDTGFGTDGKLTVDFFGSTDGAECVAVQSDGKIVVGGVARNGTTTGLGLIRILP